MVKDETPSEVRCDTDDAPVTEDGKIPSEVRYDTDVAPVHRYDTGDATATTLVTHLYKEEPSSRTTIPTPLPPGGEDAGGEPDDGSGRVGGVCDDDETELTADGPSVEGWQVLRDCLPKPMQALDGVAAVRVLALLGERLDAGWKPESIHDTLAGNALPREVRSLGGLVMHRVRAIPVDGAPPRVGRTTAAQREPEPQGPQFVRLASVERRRAVEAGEPDRGALWYASRFPGLSRVPRDTPEDRWVAVHDSGLVGASSQTDGTPVIERTQS